MLMKPRGLGIGCGGIVYTISIKAGADFKAMVFSYGVECEQEQPQKSFK